MYPNRELKHGAYYKDGLTKELQEYSIDMGVLKGKIEEMVKKLRESENPALTTREIPLIDQSIDMGVLKGKIEEMVKKLRESENQALTTQEIQLINQLCELLKEVEKLQRIIKDVENDILFNENYSLTIENTALSTSELVGNLKGAIETLETQGLELKQSLIRNFKAFNQEERGDNEKQLIFQDLETENQILTKEYERLTKLNEELKQNLDIDPNALEAYVKLAIRNKKLSVILEDTQKQSNKPSKVLRQSSSSEEEYCGSLMTE